MEVDQGQDLDFFVKNDILYLEVFLMAAAKVKPVQATEIKNKKIAREVIAQIRRPIPASVYRKLQKKAEYIDKFFQ
ncbi:MAG: hypothetical protein FWD24_08890 [Treponema sp.]|nr:hypothetical protein [Treponema sp.]